MPTAAGLQVGWGFADITPARTVQIQGQFYERISQYVRDPISATALALEQLDTEGAVTQAVIVSCDLTNVPAALVSAVRREVSTRATSLDVASIIIAATHTHNSPVTMPGSYPDPEDGVWHPDEYRAFAAVRIADAVELAWNGRSQGGASWALRHAALGYNRRIVYADGSTRMYGPTTTSAFRGLEGTCDHGVELVYFWGEQRRLTGVVINASCPSQVVMTENYLSADFWGKARALLKHSLGDDVHMLPLCGAAGDQCPVDHVRRGRAHVVDHDEAGLEELGRRVALAVQDGIEEARSGTCWELPFRHDVDYLTLPRRRVSREDWLEARSTYTNLVSEDLPRGSSADGRARRALSVITRYHNQTDSPVFPMELHALRLGDVAFATNPFEMFIDYGLRIKGRSRAVHTCIIQLACDSGMYLPTRRAIEGRSYGAGPYEAPVGPEGGDVLVERTVARINDLWRSDYRLE